MTPARRPLSIVLTAVALGACTNIAGVSDLHVVEKPQSTGGSAGAGGAAGETAGGGAGAAGSATAGTGGSAGLAGASGKGGSGTGGAGTGGAGTGGAGTGGAGAGGAGTGGAGTGGAGTGGAGTGGAGTGGAGSGGAGSGGAGNGGAGNGGAGTGGAGNGGAGAAGASGSAGGCVVEAVAGQGHTCVRKTDGTVWCWGLNNSGQIGNGQSGQFVATPVLVSFGGAPATSLGRGHQNNLAVTSDGVMWCWGWAGDGECADGGAGGTRPKPIQTLFTSATTATGGYWHGCGIKTDGSLSCWGTNSTGQVGDGSSGPSKGSPTAVALPSVTQLCGGVSHTCARTADGKAWCWGSAAAGQIGNGASNGKQTTPYNVAAVGSSVAEVTCGQYHSCARTSAGAVWCWGKDLDGQIGDGTTAMAKPNPVQLASLGSSVAQIAAWGDFTCARKTDGTVWCWGNNGSGQLGNGQSGTSEPSPVQVSLAGKVVDVVAGLEHACARRDDGTLWCWGKNADAQLGLGQSGADAPAPVQALVPCPLAGPPHGRADAGSASVHSPRPRDGVGLHG